MIMTKASEEKCYKGVYTGIMEREEKQQFLLWCLSLDYKMAISNHTLGDYITIKTIIEILVISISILKNLRISIKQTTNPNSSIISAFHF
jgi:hypothetical protein